MARTRKEIKELIKPPLTREHLELLNKLLRECALTADYCARCESCNMDVSKPKADNAEQMDTATRIKRAFFPGEV